MNPKPFLLPSDLRSLLGMLWEDRKLYLQALSTTYFPGLSGVMFVLWRYLDANPAIESARPSELMIVPFCDLLWRTMLVATEDQLTPLQYINNLAHHIKQANLWDESPKFVDSADSRAILHAFNARLAPADLRLFKPLSLANLGVLLQFVTGSVQSESEDLFPALFGGTIECVWRAVKEGDLSSDEIVEVTGSVFSSLR
ncbi:hypothetical protein RSOL_454070 [Rhizoctonia solani AG-3 Rhs1AP]|uniref:Uncharacterized protein n=1 Tax=Rhizoctonia solani AG-3 Rhs1AP TaxID=1086054 RepID=X8JFT5_9AGAM|nr:hypothetical protein RSOL_454070 [Rhizoctonia solani AG-3 Rhs1AP]